MYVIEAWELKNGYWNPCHGNCLGARWFVFSNARSIRGDRLHGRMFRTRELAEAAIREKKDEESNTSKHNSEAADRVQA